MNNLFCFHGVDNKVGVTMIAQSVAEFIANENPKLDVLFAVLNGRKNCQYVREDVTTVDEYKLQIDSKLFISKDLKRDCKYKNNLYVLGGLLSEEEERYYFPDAVKYLLEAAEGDFDVIIVDTGSSLDNGLALGALTNARKNYMAITQLESNLRRYEERIDLFTKTNVNFERIIVNKFSKEDPHTLKYIADRFLVESNDLLRLEENGYGRQAETEYKTFVEFGEEQYIEGIRTLSNEILETMNYPPIREHKKGKKWRSFI